MSPHEEAIRLVALRQHALTSTPEARSMQRAYRDELAVIAAERHEILQAILNLFATEIALDRNSRALPAPDRLPSPPRGTDVQLDTTGDPANEEIALVDLLAADLAAFPDWTITVTLPEGGTVTARPPRDQEATAQAPTASLAPERYPVRTTSHPDHPEPAERA